MQRRRKHNVNSCLKSRRVFCRVRQEFSFRGDMTDYDVNPQRNVANMCKSSTATLPELSLSIPSFVPALIYYIKL